MHYFSPRLDIFYCALGGNNLACQAFIIKCRDKYSDQWCSFIKYNASYINNKKIKK